MEEEQGNYINISRSHEELSMEDTEKLSHGRKRFRAKNDGAALDGAEILFRMNRQELTMENAAKLVEVMERGQISKANYKTATCSHHQDHQVLVSSSSSSRQPTFDRQPQFGYSFDGTKLPRLPPFRQLHDIIERCSEPFAKQLTQTDTSRSHNRLAFNKDDVQRAILPFLGMLNYDDIDFKVGIPVTTYDPRGENYQMVFKAWAEKKIYVFNTVGWNQFVKDNELVDSRDWVSVWMFSRKGNGNLCVALDINRFPTPKFIKKRSKRDGRK